MAGYFLSAACKATAPLLPLPIMPGALAPTITQRTGKGAMGHGPGASLASRPQGLWAKPCHSAEAHRLGFHLSGAKGQRVTLDCYGASESSAMDRGVYQELNCCRHSGVVGHPCLTSRSPSPVLSPGWSVGLKAELQTQPSESFQVQEKTHGHQGTSPEFAPPGPCAGAVRTSSLLLST